MKKYIFLVPALFMMLVSTLLAETGDAQYEKLAISAVKFSYAHDGDDVRAGQVIESSYTENMYREVWRVLRYSRLEITVYKVEVIQKFLSLKTQDDEVSVKVKLISDQENGSSYQY